MSGCEVAVLDRSHWLLWSTVSQESSCVVGPKKVCLHLF